MQNEQSKPQRETMICTCRQDGQIRAEARRLEVQQLLAVADPSMLCETLIMSLAFDFEADVEVYADQWFALDVEAAGFSDDIQADHPLDGMIELWLRLREAFPEKISRPPERSPQTEIWSARQIQRLQLSDSVVAEHDAKCPECLRRPGDPDKTPKRCKAGLVLWLESVYDRKAIIGKWGAPTMRQSPRFWGER